MTRLASVFHSQLPDVVGNVRSGRSSDVDIVGQLSRPLFVWSGGNPIVTGQILAAQRGATASSPTPRSTRRRRPTTGRTTARRPTTCTCTPRSCSSCERRRGRELRHRCSPTGMTPRRFRPVRSPCFGVTIVFTPNAKISYAWDAERHGWDRFQVDSQHGLPTSVFDADGGQVAPENVVVLSTPYGVSAADKNSPQAFTVGEGDALVFTDGHVIGGRWVRPSANGPAQLLDGAGQLISLMLGRDLVELPRIGASVAVFDQATADGFLAVRADHPIEPGGRGVEPAGGAGSGGISLRQPRGRARTLDVWLNSSPKGSWRGRRAPSSSSGAWPRCSGAASSWTSSTPSRPRSPRTPVRVRRHGPRAGAVRHPP